MLGLFMLLKVKVILPQMSLIDGFLNLQVSESMFLCYYRVKLFYLVPESGLLV